MKFKGYILLLLILLSIPVYSQQEQDTCIRDNAFRYTVSGTPGMLYHWKAEGGTIISPDTLNDTIYVKWSTFEGNYKLSVYGELDGCFSDERYVDVKIKKTPYFSLGPDIELCEGESYTFEAPENYLNSIWNGNSPGLHYTVERPGLVWLKVVDNESGCDFVDSTMVTVKPLPYFKLAPKDTITLCGNQKMILRVPDFAINYEWSGGFSGKARVIDKLSENVSLTISDWTGCSFTDSIYVNGCDIAFYHDSINTFTPNGDGINDNWKVLGIEQYSNASVEVFDRWGRTVFKKNGRFIGNTVWDGKLNGSGNIVPMDTYFYVINPNVEGKRAVAGYVTIIK